MKADRVTVPDTKIMEDPPIWILLPKEVAERALALLTNYANSGVPDATSLECAQVCRVLRERL